MRWSLAAGGAVLALLLAAALISLVWTPYSPLAIDMLHRLARPSPLHPLGSDAYGHDVLSMLMAGSRLTLSVGLLAVLAGAAAGVPAGVIAARAGGWTDALTMRAADLLFAFPALLTAVMLAATSGPSAMNAVVAIGIFNVPVFARVARAAALGVWRRDYVLAARVAGRGEWALAWRHVLPNIAPALVVQATIQFALAIVADAALAYVGLGAPPPTPSWGRMLNDAQTYIFRDPLLAIFPGLAISLSVLGLNLLGDGLQDALDPRTRRPGRTRPAQ
jgi:peptide/nickel transport system permease protein